MPELPQMQALSERIGSAFAGKAFAGYTAFAFHGLKTAVPAPETVIGQTVIAVGRRAKYVWFEFPNGERMLFHLSQAGRLDIEPTAKITKPKGSVVRWKFGDGSAILLREFGTERKAGWWMLAAGDDGPLAKLGPEPESDAFAELIRTSTDGRRIHTLLRDQRTVSGIGRGYSDDILHRAKLSPFASLKSMTPDTRECLLSAIEFTLSDGLERERQRTGGLSESKLGEHFLVHGKHGLPCPTCGTDLQHVSYESHEVVYCPACQTNGQVLADRRMSRLLK
jgi:formamidopyrimidine-DNA glycosylase